MRGGKHRAKQLAQQIKYIFLYLVLQLLQFGNELLFLPNISVKHRCPEGILIIKGEVIQLMYNHRAYVLKQQFEKMMSIYINTFSPKSHLCWYSKIGINRYLKIPYLK